MAVGDNDIIGDVTECLNGLLTESGLDVTLDSPAGLKHVEGSWEKVNLYLYQVLENAHAKNQPWVTQSPAEQRYPPLALNLYYLVTPYASDPLSAHRVLSHTMRTFHDNTILQGPILPQALRLSGDQFTLSLCPLKLEDLTRIWNALQTPYRLSVSYEVRVALIASMTEREVARVEQQILRYAQLMR